MGLDSNNNKLLGGLFHFFFRFKKVKISNSAENKYFINNNSNQIEKQTEAIKAEFYLIFPNVNLRIKRISTLKLSNSSKINKFLVKKLENSNQINDELLDWGYLGMSSEHRIVALLNNKESRQQIIFGVWINFPKEPGIKKNISDSSLESILMKYKEIIFQNCLKFLFASEKINEIDSPSPDENVFLLIVFISGIPFNFEVNVFPNEVDKAKENEFGNDWLIAKQKIIIDKNNLFNSNNLKIMNSKNKDEIEFDIKRHLDRVHFKTLNNFINEKLKLKSKTGNNNNNVKSIIRNNSINYKKQNSSSSNKRSNDFINQNESNINKLSDINSKNFLRTDSNEINFFNQNNEYNSTDNLAGSNNNRNPYVPNCNQANQIYLNLDNRIIEKTENYKNYRDKLNDLFERDSEKNINLAIYDVNHNSKETNKNNPNYANNINNLKSELNLNNEIAFSASNKKNLLKDNTNINFNYDYPLKIVEKIGRSNSVNKEVPKSKAVTESNSHIKNSYSESNQCKNIPRGQSVNNSTKNPDKELTYIDSFSKDINNFTESRTSFNKLEDKRIDPNNNFKNHNNPNICSKNMMGYIYNTPDGYPISLNPLNESETLSINTNQDSRQDTLKTVSISNKYSYSREKKSIIDKKGFLEQNISDNNYIQESIINSGSKHKKFFSMLDGNKSNSLVKNPSQIQNNISNYKNNLRINNPSVFQSHQFNQQQSNLINESDFDFIRKNLDNNNINISQKNKNNLTSTETNMKNNFIDHNNNLKNAYTIIYDQANSIQILQDKVSKLQTELENVASKLKNQSDEKSLTCDCGNRRSNEKHIPLISTGTNTSLDLIQNYNLENSAVNSLKSNNNINFNQKNSKEIIEEKEILKNKTKSDEDNRYDNLLNDNSINFPKQFLDIDSKHYDSHRDDTHYNNTQLNSNQKDNYSNKESSNRKASNYVDNINKKNININTNYNENISSNYVHSNNVVNSMKKNTSINSISSNNCNLNVTNTINDLNNNDNINLVSFNNTSYYGTTYPNKFVPNYQSNNIIYSSDFSLNNNELKKMGHNIIDSKDINFNNKNNIENNNHPVSNDNINNHNNFKKEKMKLNKIPSINNVFSTIQSMGQQENNEFTYNIPFKPNNKYQTIENITNTYKDNNIIKRVDSEYNFSNKNSSNYQKENSTDYVNEDYQKKKENIIKNSETDRKYYIPNNIQDTLSNQNSNNQLANSFITHLDKLNDSSFIAHDLDHQIKFEVNENKKYQKENIEEDKFKIEIPKTYGMNSNLDLTGNDNTSINYDISQSIDPCTQRLFLKAPSMLGKTNISVSRDDTDFCKINRNKQIIENSTSHHNDKTINIPKIFFDNNDSLDSIDQNE